MGQQKNLSYEEEQIIINAYINEKRGQLYCAKLVNTSTRIVKRILNKYNIPIRDFAHAAIESNKNRKGKVNDFYFSEENHNMAYIMGFLAADGHIHKKDNGIEIGLSSVDIDFLQNIKKELNIEHEVKESMTSNGYPQCRLSFSSEQIKKDLSKYGITYNKTFELHLPKLQNEFKIDFIRGLFDGDGSISTAGDNAIRWQICSATKDILEEIVNFLFEYYNIPKVNIQIQKRNNPLYVIQYSTISTRKIFNILYYENCFCLPRKYNKFKQLI